MLSGSSSPISLRPHPDSWATGRAWMKEIRHDGDEAFLGQPVGYRGLPVGEAEDLVNHDHRRRLGLPLGIGDVGADGVRAPLDLHPLAVGGDRVHRHSPRRLHPPLGMDPHRCGAEHCRESWRRWRTSPHHGPNCSPSSWQLPELDLVLHQLRHRHPGVLLLEVDVSRRCDPRRHFSGPALFQHEEAGVGPAGDHQRRPSGSATTPSCCPGPEPSDSSSVSSRLPSVDPLAQEGDDHERFLPRIPGNPVGSLELGGGERRGRLRPGDSEDLIGAGMGDAPLLSKRTPVSVM